MMHIEIRGGSVQDTDYVIGLDPFAQADQDRSAFIISALESGTCCVVESNSQVIGYGVLSYSFYGHGMVDLLFVREKDRRQGVGSVLLDHMVERCKTSKLFTSTNQSNTPMQRLLIKCDFVRSGVIENLDEGDPELVFFRQLG